MKQARCLLGAVVLGLLLQGCMTAPPAPPPDDSLTREQPEGWQARQAELRDINQWTLQGKVAVRHEQGNDSAVIREWVQNGDQFLIEMSSAFMGMGSVRLEGSPTFLTITDSEGQQYLSDDPDALIRETLGWSLPVEALYVWVRGLPLQDSPADVFFDEQGRISHLRQQGWEIHYSNYATLAGVEAVPHSLTATRDDLRLRLVITRWTPETP
ncbi:outer membrane lipoprotein LolB [Halovibrio salipaludis]|uniref:Outer-membrane lipoprotein LolB n=1 Tax=Halovibrio salipaludis TaxID=2032626 RepID=A0A2A2F600_9GAMM|nr:lipoprotein insertase outer membrane protein LolB [Halovibrio salipaludis]PAU80032.1 outer membrane lipoprotein LolB [Halovibrio salipaludis]